MKIGIYVSYFPRLSETFIQRLVIGLLSEGHEVTVFAHGPGESSSEAGRSLCDMSGFALVYRGRIPRLWIFRLGAAIVRLPHALICDAPATVRCLSPMRFGREALGLRPFLNAVPFIVHARRVDVVHAQYAHLGERLARLRGALRPTWRLAVSFRGSDISAGLADRGERPYEALRTGADLFLPVSDYFRRRLLGLGFPPARTHVFRSGIDARGYVELTEHGRQDAHADSIRVITVGRLTPKKGIDVCLRGMARFVQHLNQADPSTAVEYVIIGDGPQRACLERLAEELGISRLVAFRGGRPHAEVIEELARSDVFLNHSVVGPDGDEEGIPNVIKEAYLCGLPVIATRHAGIPELVEDDRSGLLVHEHDADGIASALSALFHDPSRRTQFADAGKQRVERDYDAVKLSKRLSQLFAELQSSTTGQRDYGADP
jgi:colanic acid/amylovoran biosynthesis glycosyltransferase